MPTEREWVQSLQPLLQESLKDCGDGEWRVAVCTGKKLTYANEILLYRNDGSHQNRHAGYETDLLVYDIRDNGDWVPRVVVECKLGSVTTHDALTYSAKAATHKHVHPYLRYGTLVGAFGNAVPGRLIQHGAYFDFMMVWWAEEATEDEWSDLTHHDRKLYVGGVDGRYMVCKDCRGLPADRRPLFSQLPRALALRKTCDVLASLVRADTELVSRVS